MHVDLGPAGLRKPELRDLEQLLLQKNDPEVASGLGGFSTGYTRSAIAQWIEAHGTARDEALYVIVNTADQCLGHVGLYKIDVRIRAAEFAIMIGNKSCWGSGIGRACVNWALRYGFDELGLHRIYLEVIETNERAIGLYRSSGFSVDGRMRHGQYRSGRWLDLVQMSILEDEWRAS